jgi:hypothetical protein
VTRHKHLLAYFVVVTLNLLVAVFQIGGSDPFGNGKSSGGHLLYGSGFKTEFAARLAGEKALRELVSQMRKQ